MFHQVSRLLSNPVLLTLSTLTHSAQSSSPNLSLSSGPHLNTTQSLPSISRKHISYTSRHSSSFLCPKPVRRGRGKGVARRRGGERYNCLAFDRSVARTRQQHPIASARQSHRLIHPTLHYDIACATWEENCLEGFKLFVPLNRESCVRECLCL